MKFQIIAGELCLDFVNTLDNRPVPERREELLHSYRDLADWALEINTISAVQHAQLVRAAGRDVQKAAEILRAAIRLRECLYRVFGSILKRRQPAGADLTLLNAYISEAFSHMQLKASASGFRIGWDEDEIWLDLILWRIARSASDLLTSSDLRYVRECADSTCRWIFVDRSKNHSRRWCDMKVCGNRVKARKFYRSRVIGSSGRRVI
jgi:predicted RNA-binding Zn ribbon-like protein